MKKGVLLSKAIGQTGFLETQLLICDNFVLQFNGYKVVWGINFWEQDVKYLENKILEIFADWITGRHNIYDHEALANLEKNFSHVLKSCLL